jgi:hypothetical protein
MKASSIQPDCISTRRSSLVSKTGYDSVRENSPRKIAGIVISVFAHLLMLWLIIQHKTVLDQKTKSGSENAITYLNAPEASTKPAPAKSAPAPAKTAPPKKTPKTVTRSDAPPLIRPDLVAVEPAPLPAKSEPVQAPAEDMSAMLDAARKRRNDARERDRDPNEASEETEAQRANRIARANIGRAGNAQGRDQNDAGGVFQVRRMGVSSGEFFFRGWNTAFGRTSNQLINVFAGDGDDIQLAMVKKMIEIIRAEKPDEFMWDSRRLGRTITLNAGPAHRAELTQFLLSEFFPEYAAARRR